uniref:Hydrogenase maturation factor HypA n=1 Tax=Candidatus Methanomethylicus mesodigestus TaxID=1867258 RepID=A0A7C3J4G6_9CREN
MHELSLAVNVVDYLTKLAKEQRLSEVNEVYIEIGDLTHINGSQLKFSLKMASEGTVAQGAKFFVRRRRASMKCNACGKSSKIDMKGMLSDYEFRCPRCKSKEVEFEQGKELVLKRVKGSKKKGA